MLDFGSGGVCVWTLLGRKVFGLETAHMGIIFLASQKKQNWSASYKGYNYHEVNERIDLYMPFLSIYPSHTLLPPTPTPDPRQHTCRHPRHTK